MPQPADVQIPVSAIAEFLAKSLALSPLSTAETVIDVNRCLFQLAILLPAPLFRIVRDSAMSGDLESIYEAIIQTRAAIGSPGSLTTRDAACHSPPSAEVHSVH
jgi:hypothetical protein